MKWIFPTLAILTAVLLSYALRGALITAPTDQMQGDVYRIIYYHVPSAWTAFLLFFINFVASVQYLVRPSKQADRIAKWCAVAVSIAACGVAAVISVWPIPYDVQPSAVATTGFIITGIYFAVRKLFSDEATDILALVAAEVGVVFCTVVLVTGPIWARPVWGIWWAPGDIRLTSTLVMWLIYVSYLVLRRFSNSSQTARLAATLAVFGALDIPLVYFSIWFYRTQHPQPIIGGAGSGGSIDPHMLHVLLINLLAFLSFAGLVCWSRYRLEVVKRRLDEAHALEALQDSGSSR
jgi:heme exporter protein C